MKMVPALVACALRRKLCASPREASLGVLYRASCTHLLVLQTFILNVNEPPSSKPFPSSVAIYYTLDVYGSFACIVVATQRATLRLRLEYLGRSYAPLSPRADLVP